MKTQTAYFRTPNWRLRASFLIAVVLLAACTETDPLNPVTSGSTPNPFIALGMYEGSYESADKSVVTYQMIIRTEGERDDRFVVSNFADLKTEVVAFGEGDGISFPEQGLGVFDEAYHVLLSGHAAQTPEHLLKLRYRVHEGNIERAYEIEAVYVGECK